MEIPQGQNKTGFLSHMCYSVLLVITLWCVVIISRCGTPERAPEVEDAGHDIHLIGVVVPIDVQHVLVPEREVTQRRVMVDDEVALNCEG